MLADRHRIGIAMPAAAKMLADNNLSATQVTGTGKDGRVTKGDVISQLDKKAAPAVCAVASARKPALQQVAHHQRRT